MICVFDAICLPKSSGLKIGSVSIHYFYPNQQDFKIILVAEPSSALKMPAAVWRSIAVWVWATYRHNRRTKTPKWMERPWYRRTYKKNPLIHRISKRIHKFQCNMHDIAERSLETRSTTRSLNGHTMTNEALTLFLNVQEWPTNWRNR